MKFQTSNKHLYFLILIYTSFFLNKLSVIDEFIKLYESEPCLWYIKSKDYRNRNKKDTACAKLVNKEKLKKTPQKI